MFQVFDVERLKIRITCRRLPFPRFATHFEGKINKFKLTEHKKCLMNDGNLSLGWLRLEKTNLDLLIRRLGDAFNNYKLIDAHGKNFSSDV